MKIRKIFKSINRYGQVQFRSEAKCVEIKKAVGSYFIEAEGISLEFKFKNLKHVKQLIKILTRGNYKLDNSKVLPLFMKRIIAYKREALIV